VRLEVLREGFLAELTSHHQIESVVDDVGQLKLPVVDMIKVEVRNRRNLQGEGWFGVPADLDPSLFELHIREQEFGELVLVVS